MGKLRKVTNQILLSIIVPIGNSIENFDNLSSWIHKINKNTEVILIWDGLNDISERKRLLKLENKSISNIYENGIGPGGARNKGLEVIKGKWYVFCDADDVIYPERIIYSLVEVDENKDLLVFNFETLNVISNKNMIAEPCKNINMLTSQVGIWRIIFRKEIFGVLRFPNLRMAEDQIYLMKCKLDSRKIEYKTEISYKYFISNQNQLTNSRVAKHEIIYAFEEAQSEFEFNQSEINLYFLLQIFLSTLKYAVLKNKIKATNSFLRCMLTNKIEWYSIMRVIFTIYLRKKFYQ